MRKAGIFLAGFISICISTMASSCDSIEQAAPSPLQLDKANMFKPIVAIEAWSIFGSGEKEDMEECADRSDVYLRRFRFGAGGQAYPFLSYSFMLHFDRIGVDEFSATKGSYSGIGLWNAFTTIKVLRDSELLNFHIGYFWAAVSRDYMTSPWSVTSFDKSYSTYYLRHFITGRGSGITSGVALGGIQNFSSTSLSYRVGVYDPQVYLSSQYASRLYTGRFMWTWGDAEQSKYNYMVSGNSWSKRNGITLGVGGSAQKNGLISDDLYFGQSYTYGADVLACYGGFSIQGEYYMMRRDAESYKSFRGELVNIRMGYNIKVKSTFLEPSISYDQYSSTGDDKLYSFVGDDRTFDMGINWYLNKDKLKVALHYVLQDGSVACNTGNYVGLAFQFRL